MDKQPLRIYFKKERDCLSSEEIRKYSTVIYDIFTRVFYFQQKSAIMCYLSASNEVKTSKIIDFLHSSKCLVCAPCMINNTIKPCRITSGTKFKKSAFGIKEPSRKRTLLKPKDIDAAIIPGLAFDPQGNRLGFGCGYFDKFLAGAQKNILKIALAFSCQMTSKLPSEKHDIKMDFIITEKGIIDCGKKIKKKNNL
ncbi:MAG: 5-formyltetrahydrofolate cyclo-ligase [Candidatus Goldiibacteriota bacterium]